MSEVRVFVGTKKGAFVLTADGTFKSCQASGPHSHPEMGQRTRPRPFTDSYDSISGK
jgi:hypothetical protein